MSAEKILIVADDLHLSLAIGKFCQRLGLRSQITSDGLYALLQAVEDVPRLIMIDAATDGLDPFALCELLHNDVRVRNVPIIMLVHVSDKAALQRCQMPGVFLVVKESKSQQSLPQRLEELVEEQFSGRTPASTFPLARIQDGVRPSIAMN